MTGRLRSDELPDIGTCAAAQRMPSVASPMTEVYPASMKQISYCVYREDEFYVSQCLNVDVSSFGTTREEAVASLKEAVELYFEGESAGDFSAVTDAAVGQELVNA
jgi:predicted RNase H-like HicB family nuclease